MMGMQGLFACGVAAWGPLAMDRSHLPSSRAPRVGEALRGDGMVQSGAFGLAAGSGWGDRSGAFGLGEHWGEHATPPVDVARACA